MIGPMRHHRHITIATGLLVCVAAGCGGSSGSSAPAGSSGGSAGTAPTSSGAGGLVAEAQSAAAGDIPDNQVFLAFHNGPAGYSMSYPEGWARQGASGSVL